MRGTSSYRSPTTSAFSVFLSTFPLRGTSLPRFSRPPQARHFYPRSPCGERPTSRLTGWATNLFLSTFPLRGTSILVPGDDTETDISIHVPLAGNVLLRPAADCLSSAFLSTFPLRGTSQLHPLRIVLKVQFLSTFPLRGTSPRLCALPACHPISIHVPLAGNVPPSSRIQPSCLYFYPRSPCGERPALELFLYCPVAYFYPRSPCGERHADRELLAMAIRFLSTFPLRGTSALIGFLFTVIHISIHVPLAGNVCL